MQDEGRYQNTVELDRKVAERKMNGVIYVTENSKISGIGSFAQTNDAQTTLREDVLLFELFEIVGLKVH